MEKAEKITGDARRKVIVRTSLIGIGSNLLLAGFKAVIGFLTGSIAIMMDAVNNLSDALSSVITIIGTRLAMKRPDREHPLGHGRYEYIAAEIISAVILYAGITSFVESVKKIIQPQTPDYTPVSLIIVGTAVIVKILLGTYVKKQGIRANSDSLRDSGKDALFDAVISATTLLAAVIFLVFGWSLEAWLGALISLYIIKSGIDMFRETMSRILGERVDSELSQAIKETICNIPGVSGAYDLILHSYGPDKWQGSVHIEVPDTWTADEIDRVSRQIQELVYDQQGVILTGIGIYARNTAGGAATEALSRITEAVMSEDQVLQIHGFNYNEAEKTIRFDIVLDFAADRAALFQKICEKVQAMYPDFKVLIVMDSDISD
ncbi:MAG: cation transporter [Lachnospiraceae bacterium]|nr:cation transporter [Lachnospiraceae bacterium]